MKSLHRYSLVALGLFFILAVSPVFTAPIIMWTGSEISLKDSRYLHSKPMLDKIFTSYHPFRLATHISGTTIKSSGGSLRLKLGTNYDWNVKLYEQEIRSQDYVLRTASGASGTTSPRSPLTTYRGAISGEPGSSVCLTLQEGSMCGYITCRNKRLYLEPMTNFDRTASSSDVILYSAADVNPDSTGGTCATAMVSDPGIGQIVSSLHKKMVESCKTAQIAFAADYSMYQAYGSTAGVENRILSIMNLVSDMYADPRINISYEIVEIFVETTDANTWGSTLDFSNNLTSLNSWSRSSNGFSHTFDICSLWWYYPGGGTVGMAGIGVVCSQSRPGNVIRDYTKSTYSLMLDQAHELGHNWGASHINDANDLMYPSITGSNDQWTSPTITSIISFKNKCTCLDGCDQPPKADFSMKDSLPCKGGVQFVNLSKYGPQTWLWNFGDGTTSTEENPFHNYLQNKTYTVSLAVTNSFGKDSITRPNYLTINAPALPTISGQPSCINGKVTLTCSASGTIRWYSVGHGTLPLATGATFTTPALTQLTTYYIENGSTELPLQTIGPVDTSAGANGAYKEDAGNIYMTFRALKDIKFQSFTAYANKAGKRHFILTTNNLATTVDELIIDLPTGTTVVPLNWDCNANTTYQLVLENTASTTDTTNGTSVYYNNLYRSRDGFTYPITIQGVASVTSNYWLDQNSGLTAGWYIGYNWHIQEYDKCASARVAISIDPSTCSTGTMARQEKSSSLQVRIIACATTVFLFSNQTSSYTFSLFDLSGRCILSRHIPITNQSPGMQSINCEKISHGTYLAKVTADNQCISRMITIIY